MKHNVKITLILLSMFIVAQLRNFWSRDRPSKKEEVCFRKWPKTLRANLCVSGCKSGNRSPITTANAVPKCAGDWNAYVEKSLAIPSGEIFCVCLMLL